jgi:hypothetical protein
MERKPVSRSAQCLKQRNGLEVTPGAASSTEAERLVKPARQDRQHQQNATMLVILIIGFTAGPAVSL